MNPPPAPGSSRSRGAHDAASTVPSKSPALDKCTVNLTDAAKQGKIDPVLGRDEEIRQIIDILIRRRQNNPILTGEAGVGKTAVVEGFALRIASGDVPDPLKGVTIRSLDLGFEAFALIGMSRIYRSEGNFVESEACCNRVLMEKPGFERALEELSLALIDKDLANK